MLKIAQINCVYGKGSTGTLTQNLHRMLLSRGFQSLVFYGRGEAPAETGVYRVGGELTGKANALRARITGIPYGGCELNTARLLARLREEKPDVVHLQCINGNFVNVYRLVSFLKEERIPTVLTLHAEFMYTANCSHSFDCEQWKTGCASCGDYRRATHSWLADRTAQSWKRMADAFDGFRQLSVIPVSPWQEERARCSPFFRNAAIRTILNGVDLSVFHPADSADGKRGKTVLYVTPRLDQSPGHIKGGEYIVPLARLLGRKARILVVGPGEGKGLPDNVSLLGPIKEPEKLARLYAEADVTLLTSRRETFSMVAAESLCCGTPVLGFRAGGPESIAIADYSRFVEQGNIEALAEAILTMEPKDSEAIGRAAAERYGKDRMFEEYLDEYRKVRTRL